jgi:hypothetical protein
MWKSSSVVGLAFCLSVAATTCMAASDSGGNVGSQRVTGTQLGSPQGESGNGKRIDCDTQPSQSVVPGDCRPDGINTT